MPINRKNCATNRLFQMFTSPPVIIFLKIANRNTSSTTGHCKLFFIGRPTYKGGCTIDTKQDKSRLPNTTFVCPNIRVSILRTSDNTVGLGCKIDTRNNFVVLMWCLINFILFIIDLLLSKWILALN